MGVEPIFLTPVFKERIWGGTALADRFDYEIPSLQTGECWAISAHPHGQSTVAAGTYKGMALGTLWEQHGELFGRKQGADCRASGAGDRPFPLLTKIIDANADLSVQVHPDDTYAHAHENGELGKTECWYVIDCAPDAHVVYGHTAQTREQLAEMIARGEWEELLCKVKIAPGDFLYVPSGSIHALCAGTLILETQQSSDTTYRVYDYDRVDKEGNKRELHLQKAIDVTTVPHVDGTDARTEMPFSGGTVTTFVENRFFTVQKWTVTGELPLTQDAPYMLVSVIDGKGQLTCDSGMYPLQRGDHLILPHGFGAFTVSGQLEAIVSRE